MQISHPAQAKSINPPPSAQPLGEVKAIEQPEPVYNLIQPEQPETWEPEVNELEKYFAGIVLPTQPIKLNSCSTITDCSKFIETHLATIKANNGKRKFLPYLNRLQELKQVLNINLMRNLL